MAPPKQTRQPARLLICLLLSLAGCSSAGRDAEPGIESVETGPASEEVAAVPELTFYRLAYRRDRTRLFWQEWPHYVDTQLTLGTPLADCDVQALYAYSTEGTPRQVSRKGTPVTPVRLRNTDEELSAWAALPDDRCSALITVGYWIEDAFMGLSLSTGEGVFRRVPARFPMEGSEDGQRLESLRGITGQLQQAFPQDWDDRRMTISFDFPGGRRAEATLSLMEAAAQLDGSLYRSTAPRLERPWESVRFWTRAALARLELDFREQAEEETGSVLSAVLTSVNGVRGAWWFDTGDGRGVTSVLSTPVEQARHIRFRVE